MPLAVCGRLGTDRVLAAPVLVAPDGIDILVNLAAFVGAPGPDARETTVDAGAVLGAARTDAILAAKAEIGVARRAVVGAVVTGAELTALMTVAVLCAVVTPAVFAALGPEALVSAIPILGLAVGATLVPDAAPRTVEPDAKPATPRRSGSRAVRGTKGTPGGARPLE